jgi:hypothetical protein
MIIKFKFQISISLDWLGPLYIYPFYLFITYPISSLSLYIYVNSFFYFINNNKSSYDILLIKKFTQNKYR